MNTPFSSTDTAGASTSGASTSSADAAGRVLNRSTQLIRAGAGLALSLALVASYCLPSLATAAEVGSNSSEQTTEQDESTSSDLSEGGSGQNSSSGSSSQMEEPPDGEGGSSLGEPPDGYGGGSLGDSGNAQGNGQGQRPDGQGDAGGGAGGAGGANTQSFDYSGSYSATLVADGQEASSNGESIEATESLSNAALAQNGGTLTIENSSLNKSGDATDGDSCNFYGVNSVLLAVGEDSTANVSNTQINATSEGSNGIFATDSATVYAQNVTITTQQDNSRGLDATYGGTVIADKATITTQGSHCAAFATDRGGGNISVQETTATTTGQGSPLIYSTGAIEVENVVGSATGSQIAGMEGLNTIRIANSTLESTITGTSASDPVPNGVILYQSTSGDADTSTGDAAHFEAESSSLVSAITSGAMFYCTNTCADVVLKETVLDFDSKAAALVRAEGNSSNNWGTPGSNGATISFTGITQHLEGDAIADTTSSLSIYLLEGSSWSGAAEITENASGSTSEAPLTVNVDAESTWNVTHDCTISALNVAEGGSVVDAEGKSATIVAAGQVVVHGESDITVTVEGAYSTTVEVGSGQQIQGATIDRSGDASNANSADNNKSESANDSTTNEGSGNGVWDQVVAFLKILFGLVS